MKTKLDLINILENDSDYIELMATFTDLKVMSILADDIPNQDIREQYKEQLDTDLQNIRDEMIKKLGAKLLEVEKK